MSLETPSGTGRLGCNSDEMARSSCDSKMKRTNYSSEDTKRSTCCSDVVVIDDQGLQMKTPAARNLNVVNSKGIVIGTPCFTVTQNVGKVDVVKDLPFCRYICHLAKRTTKSEIKICATALFIFLMCIVLFVHISKETDLEDEEPQIWLIERKEWLSREFENTKTLYQPIPLVVISHTVSAACYCFVQCAAAVRNIQSYYLDKYEYDIPYNFLIGTDGRVYEGLGWNIVGAHTLGYNECSIGLAFIGDYREGLSSYTKITELQIQRVHKLFEIGLENGYLHTQFKVLGMRDLRLTANPGDNIFNEIRHWSNYDHKNVFKGRTCYQIFDFFENKNITSDTTP